jgi:hypothetical protein
MSLAAHGIHDERLWVILEHGLKKHPAERWASMKDVGGELANWLIAQGITEDITGTSLERAWFREPENGDWVDVSKLTRMPSIPRQHAGGDPTCTGSRPVAAPHAVTDSDQSSGPRLGALAELGDPVEAMQRDERRRTFAVVVVLMIALAAAAVGMLAGTGIIAF